MTLVKICGLREVAPALAAARAGADLLGMVFAPSKRQITPEQGQAIAVAVREGRASVSVSRPNGQFGAYCQEVEEYLRQTRPALVGVFVNETAERVNQIASLCSLDFVQLNGDEPWAYCQAIERPVVKAVRIGSQTAQEIYDYFNEGLKSLGDRGFLCLLDSNVPGSYGGTGQTFNWGTARELTHDFPFIMAGGLTPDNVQEAIASVRPWGVDVSSGVETNGTKDIIKIEAFIKAVKGYNSGGH